MDWITSPPDDLILSAISVLAVYTAVVLFTRLAGVRAFSKMSGFDFAVTVAVGSIFASIILTNSPPLLQGVTALAVVFGLQMVVAMLRVHVPAISTLVDNRPRLIMAKGEMIPTQMAKAKITKSDLYAKLREANVLDFGQVEAVIAETTGDVSVLHHDGDGPEVHPDLLLNVIGAEAYTRHL